MYICGSVYWRLLLAPSNCWMISSDTLHLLFSSPTSLLPLKIPFSTFPVTLFVSLSAKYLSLHLCCVTLKAMKMSRRSADASQRALAYSRMVDGLNEFRLGNNSYSLTMTDHKLAAFVFSSFLSWPNLKISQKHLIT